MVVISIEVVRQRSPQLCRTGEAGLLDDLADTPIEALYHAIGLGVSGRDQPVLDALRDALLVEQVFARGLLGFAGKSVRELAGVAPI